MTTETYEAVWDKYKGRMLAVMQDIRIALSEHGFQVSQPEEHLYDEYEYQIEFRTVKGPVGIELTLLDSGYRGDDDGFVAFRLHVGGDGGRIVGVMCPYNYSEDLWINPDNSTALDERFKVFEQSTIPAEVLELVLDYVEDEKKPSLFPDD